ncbi:acetyltransferase, GNAT family [Renibacterium salmoninarum ATCC 33209]|uniref:Acetyltransferase, GNAT family n=3 Tax=Renibacterium salmoninarum TaxID=1646 RepID=A9WMC5_RENSM|nr:acetyltransferase, GNAT family [Renibacterium salmoninarum ATCC 33209]
MVQRFEGGARFSGMEYFSQPLSQMEPQTLYRVLCLRVAVFVVEQGAAYPELDGRDDEPGALMFWAMHEGSVLATLRLLDEGSQFRIGRVATALTARGKGIAAELMQRAVAVETAAGGEIVLDAQTDKQDWYAKFGFAPAGEVFYEDNIEHIPMARPGRTAS